jgi:hypothetical protein
VDLNSLATAFLNSGIGEFVERLALPAFAEFLWSAFRALRLAGLDKHQKPKAKPSE